MSKILYWHVKLYHRIFTGFNGGGFGGGGGSGSNMYGHEKLVIEGYSKDKPHFYLGDNQTIELLTDPHGLETTAVSTATVERIVSTPVYEEEPRSTFITAAEPLMKYLAENHNPHASVIVNSTSAELVTGEMSYSTDSSLKD
ncbi:hypothetical protein [Atlantibacter hermannii]|uniref:hypothetical protein n=1 Tax=Atlantibacter hermannii TaxID=565 RepID=UPI00289B8665|nr:hypothetical protein [Atlantibacter hermannii]